MFKVGDRVKAQETVTHGDGILKAIEVVGIVSEVVDAKEVYPHPPQYGRNYPTDRRKTTKYPDGSVVCRVVIDGEKGYPRNFHESQLTYA